MAAMIALHYKFSISKFIKARFYCFCVEDTCKDSGKTIETYQLYTAVKHQQMAAVNFLLEHGAVVSGHQGGVVDSVSCNSTLFLDCCLQP